MKSIMFFAAALVCISCGVSNKASYSDSSVQDPQDLQDQEINLGYGTTHSKNSPFAVQKVKMEGVKDITSYADIYEYLKGRCPGVEIIPGADGGAPSVRIRGINSFNLSTEPLYIVDGTTVIDLAGVNPRDVYSVEVLKDSSASIYGVSGTNGVIIVTTKSGHNQKE